MFKSIKSGMERKTGRSISDYSEAHFEALRAAGTDAVEISGAAGNYPTIRWHSVAEYAKNMNIEIKNAFFIIYPPSKFEKSL